MVAGSIGGGGSGSDIIVARGRHLAQLGTGTHLAQRVACVQFCTLWSTEMYL